MSMPQLPSILQKKAKRELAPLRMLNSPFANCMSPISSAKLLTTKW
jgi:hypothetical protein